jgi:WD40 repeat protein
MTDNDSQADFVDQLAEEFLTRYRRGERPAVQDYIAKHPAYADQIRDLFPALVVLEQAAPASDSESANPATAPAMPSATDLPERLGDYRIVREIGRGGMGVVYEAEQQSLGRRVALKVLARPAAQDARVVARFRRESRAAAQLHHSNIVPVHEVGEQGGLCYYAMQFIRGQALDEVFRELRNLRAGSETRAANGTELAALPDRSELSSVASNFRRYARNVARLGQQAALALAYAHERGVIHRDIKPANLLLDTTGVVWVTDFGLAKTEEQALTETGDLVGTLRYMAPERFQGECDARADIYALGLTLYELLALRPAFDAQDRLHLIEQIGRQEPARLRKLDPRIPRDLETIVMKAIEKDPRRRYASAEALAEDLRRYLADEPIRARRIGPLERLGRWGRRNPLVASLCAAVVLVAALGFAGVFGQMQVAQANEQQAKEHAVKAEQKEKEAQKERDEAQRQRDEVKALNDKLREAHKQLRRALYESDINRAHYAWKANGAELVRGLLERQRPKSGETDLRGFEWYYLDRVSHADLLTLQHDGAVTSVAYSPDGKRLAAAGTEPAEGKESVSGVVKVWDAQTGKELFTLRGHTRPVTSVSFSADGKRLASAARGAEVKVWDAEMGKELTTIQGWMTGGSVALSLDGKRLAADGSSRSKGDNFSGVRVWDVETGNALRSLRPPTRPGATPRVAGVAFSPDGQRLAATCLALPGFWEGGLKVWDLQSGKECFSAEGDTSSVAYSWDGKRLAAVAVVREAGKDHLSMVKVWNTETGEELLSVGAGFFREDTGNDVRSVVFSPDGKRLAGAFLDHTVKVWDAQTGDELFILKGHSAPVNGAAFSPDGSRLASASGDKTVKVWDARPSQNPLTFKVGGGILDDVVVSPDGNCLVVSSMRPGPGKGLGGKAKDVVRVQVLDTQTGKQSFTLRLPSGVTSLAFSPEGNRLATSTLTPFSTGHIPALWDAKTGEQLKVLNSSGKFQLGSQTGPARTASSLAFSPDGKRLATAYLLWPGGRGGKSESELKVLDAQTGKELLTVKGPTGIEGEYRLPLRVYFSPDGKHLAAASGREVKVWDSQTGGEVLSLKVGGRRLAFSPDGKRLATTGEEAKVWDAESGKELLTLKGHTDPVVDVTFSPNGKRLATTSQDRMVKLWDAETGQELLSLKGGGFSAAFTRDGNRLVSTGPDGTVTIWDATPLPEKQ